jgi:hypothetical protein
MDRWRQMCVLLGVMALSGPGCSDDSRPVGDGPKIADRSSREAPPTCTEGDRHCATLTTIQACQGGTWVDVADCSSKLDPTGKYPCTCSVTLMGICQFGGKACP